MNSAWHHLSLRKRKHKNLEEYPHANRFKRLVDRLVLFVGVALPISTIPQAYTIFAHQSAKGLSVISWFVYFLAAAIWLLYGCLHKDKLIITTNILWLIVNGIVLLGIFLY